MLRDLLVWATGHALLRPLVARHVLLVVVAFRIQCSVGVGLTSGAWMVALEERIPTATISMGVPVRVLVVRTTVPTAA